MLVEDKEVERSLQRIVRRSLGQESALEDDLMQEMRIHLWQIELKHPHETRSWLIRNCCYYARERLRSQRQAALRCESLVDGEADQFLDESESASVVDAGLLNCGRTTGRPWD